MMKGGVRVAVGAVHGLAFDGVGLARDELGCGRYRYHVIVIIHMRHAYGGGLTPRSYIKQGNRDGSFMDTIGFIHITFVIGRVQS